MAPSQDAVALRAELESALAQHRPYRQWSAELRDALKEYQRPQIFPDLRFQLVMGLLVSLGALLFDAIVLPQKFEVSLGWRAITTVPISLVALLLLREHQVGLLKFAAALTLVSFGVLEVYLASFAGPEMMARYTMGTAFLLGVACLALPFTPRELARFALTYGLVTSLAAMWPGSLPPVELGLHMSFTALVGFPCWAIGRRMWNVNARSFLLDMRDDFQRRELEHSSLLFKQLAEEDPLTGLPNRRHFERVFEERFAAGRARGPENIALMMIDLDHFKQFNDRHGHQAGDQCLRLVGAAIDAVLREHESSFARYGGEEFVLAMRERKPGDAEALAHRICRAVAEVPGSVDDAPLVTTSIGVAVASPEQGLDREEMIEMADAALYAAKHKGRNRHELVEAGNSGERLCA